MSGDIISKADIRAAIDDLLGSLVAEPGLIFQATSRITPYELDYAATWAATHQWDEKWEHDGSGQILYAIEKIRRRTPTRRFENYGAEWRAEYERVTHVSPETVATFIADMRAHDAESEELSPATPKTAADYLRRVQRIAAAPRLGEKVEAIKAAAHAEPGAERLDLRIWRTELDCDAHAIFPGDAEPTAGLPSDCLQNVSMAKLALNPRRVEYHRTLFTCDSVSNRPNGISRTTLPRRFLSSPL